MPYLSPFATDFTDDFGADQPTSRAYRLLADYLRDADTTGQLGAFLDATETALTPLMAFLEAADPDTGLPGVVQPVDPAHCRPDWLPLLAALTGADIAGLSTQQARYYLANPRGRVGSARGVADAVAATLTGTRFVAVTCPSMWEMTVTISTADITDIDQTTSIAQRAKPAGVQLTIAPLGAVTLAQLSATYANLAAITATGKTLDLLRFG